MDENVFDLAESIPFASLGIFEPPFCEVKVLTQEIVFEWRFKIPEEPIRTLNEQNPNSTFGEI